ncbi:MAG: restriction endonuclease subunit M [Candidatus Moranbacteria bacterium CG08_land_8_20_14_0_20_34_16]|nr:MAG: restriction endonuclease subunit M [Candidatus Moranbacteria bacterium CG08_land_8_20_14_0_20_34_16]
MQELTASINAKNIIDLEKTASFLGISTATVRNWVKCGYLQAHTTDNRYFHIEEIENVKANIKNGDLNKLNGRANKSKAERTFIPDEYLQDGVSVDDITKIINFVSDNNIDISLSLLLLSLNLLQREKILLSITIPDLISKNVVFANKQIGEEVKAWLSEIKNSDIKSEYTFLLNCTIPKQRDALGFLYQSLLLEGKKSQSGSYYTPEVIVNEIIKDYAKKDSKILDPCCGTGQFLLAFADVIENPKNIYGVDVDELAVRIARLNILIKYKNQNFAPNIVCKNTLFGIGNYDLFSLNDENIRDFDVIATNPPWGVHFSKSDIDRLKTFFLKITSLESFSYFLKKSIDLLRDDGTLSFILPESILNVKTHKDIREIILTNTHIEKVSYLNRVFKNVFTPVIRLDLKKSKKENNQIEIRKDDETYTAKQSKWKNNQDFVFDIHANGVDTAIIDKIYNVHHTTLAGQADWALGIVTGNNKAYIASDKQKDFEEIYKGKDVEKLALSNPSNYIKFTPEKFQQVAPIEKYRAKEKLIYRFISKYLVFAYDDKQKLTLNSANIVIPKIPNYPIKVIVALLNSSPYQFIFQKKFSSIKVLRNHIEQMPLPLWDKEIFNNIIKLVDETIENNEKFEILDNYIMKQYSFSPEEINYIKNFNK